MTATDGTSSTERERRTAQIAAVRAAAMCVRCFIDSGYRTLTHHHGCPSCSRTMETSAGDGRLIEELHRAPSFLHARGCPDGAVAVDEAIRRLGWKAER